MAGNLDEKAIKEVLKKIIENNNNIPYKAKEEIKAIIELEHNPEKLLQECLLYMLNAYPIKFVGFKRNREIMYLH